MRWSGQSVDVGAAAVAASAGAAAPARAQSEAPAAPTLPGLELAEVAAMPGHLRTVRTPEFTGAVFHEVLAKSALNRVPAGSAMPFSWTINPYRGCSHACVYCFARGSHRYLDFDTGRDFDSQIVVKVNVAEVLAREVARPSWRREMVALGTNTDPYQRAEGRYRLLPALSRRSPQAAPRSQSSQRARCCGATFPCLPRPPSACPSSSRCPSPSVTMSYSSRSSRARRRRGRDSTPWLRRRPLASASTCSSCPCCRTSRTARLTSTRYCATSGRRAHAP